VVAAGEVRGDAGTAGARTSDGGAACGGSAGFEETFSGAPAVTAGAGAGEPEEIVDGVVETAGTSAGDGGGGGGRRGRGGGRGGSPKAPLLERGPREGGRGGRGAAADTAGGCTEAACSALMEPSARISPSSPGSRSGSSAPPLSPLDLPLSAACNVSSVAVAVVAVAAPATGGEPRMRSPATS